MVKEFIIKFSGLSIGTHEFNYTLDHTFFERLDNEDFRDGNIKLQVTLNKDNSMLIFDFLFEGEIVTVCDRCLDDLVLPFQKEERIYVKFTDDVNKENESDDIIYLRHEDYQIDFYSFICETILVSLPIKKVHTEDAKGVSMCNLDMLNIINALSVKEEDKNSKVDDIDPRWSKLREIKN